MGWAETQIQRIWDRLRLLGDAVTKATTLAQQALTATSQGQAGTSGGGFSVRYAQTQSGGIPAFSSGPGSATVNETDTTGTLTGGTFTAYNFGSNISGAAGGVRIACTTDAGGQWFTFWEDCG